ncbi:MAG: VWA domain-containing protein [Thermoanaerobaculia bacterium]|nr:MAG: VWA domain-containing protein [Thermoanaerobaculia bacterium]MBZ0102615.1 VWA domain-containing protein [Thermoanaerobaculia bacterium]
MTRGTFGRLAARLALCSLALAAPAAAADNAAGEIFRIDAPASGDVLVGPVVFRFTVFGAVDRIDVFAGGKLVGSATAPAWRLAWDVPTGVAVREVRALAFRDGRMVERLAVATTAIAVDDNVDVTNVQLYPVVLDPDGHYVTDLAEADFEVLENGRPIRLEAFAAERVPAHLAVLIDTSRSMLHGLPIVQEAAGEFLDRIAPEDIVSVHGFNHGLHTLLDRSPDRGAAKRSVRSLAADGGTALYDAVLRVLAELAPRTEAEAGRRRAILLFSDGRDERSLSPLMRAVEKARESDVMIYAISAGHDLESLLARQDLKQLATETGGEFFVAEQLRDLPEIFERVIRDLASQYRLVFTPPPGARGTRPVEVRLKPRHLRVRCRTSYFAP